MDFLPGSQPHDAVEEIHKPAQVARCGRLHVHAGSAPTAPAYWFRKGSSRHSGWPFEACFRKFQPFMNLADWRPLGTIQGTHPPWHPGRCAQTTTVPADGYQQSTRHTDFGWISLYRGAQFPTHAFSLSSRPLNCCSRVWAWIRNGKVRLVWRGRKKGHCAPPLFDDLNFSCTGRRWCRATEFDSQRRRVSVGFKLGEGQARRRRTKQPPTSNDDPSSARLAGSGTAAVAVSDVRFAFSATILVPSALAV